MKRTTLLTLLAIGLSTVAVALAGAAGVAYGMYIGNYPTLQREKILRLCELLNDVAASR